MTYTPYGEFPDDEELKGFGTELKQEAMTLAPEMQAAEVEQQELEQTQVEEQADPATAEEQPEQKKEEPQEEKKPGLLDPASKPEPKQPGDEGTNPNRPPEGEEGNYKWNPQTGEYELNASAAMQMVGETVLAPAVGTVDGFTDMYNYFMPGPDIPMIPKFRDSNLQTIRDISSFVGPSLTGVGILGKIGQGIQSAKYLPNIVRAIASNPMTKWFGGLAADGAVGAVSDQSNRHSLDGNAQRAVRDMLKTPESEHLFGIFAPDWATQPEDSEDMKRAKNRNEGFGLGILSGLGIGLAKVAGAAVDTRLATKYHGANAADTEYLNKITKDEFSNIKYSDDPIEDAVARSEARTQRNLDELGEFTVAKMNEANMVEGKPFQTADELEFTEPAKGIHDNFDWNENGVRNADPDGVPGAMVSAVKIQKNIGTRNGRLGSIITEAALKYGLDVDSLQKGQLINLILDKITKSGKFSAQVGDRIISAKEIDAAGTFLAEVMEEMEPGQMKELLGEYRKLNDDLNIEVVNKVGYDAVFKSIKKYQDVFLNLDEKKARALLTTSLAGQASDMATMINQMPPNVAITEARNQIFDRMEYLMVEKGLASYDAGSTLASLNVWKRIKALADPKGAAKDYVLAQVQARERFLGKVIPKAKEFTSNLISIMDEKPHFMKPLFEAYQLLDGDVQSMYRLNQYVYENLGAIQQAFVRGENTMPNLIVEGFYANYYNSILSSTATPIRAMVGNLGGLIARPINTMVGSLVSGDVRNMHRAWVQYSGAVGAFTEAFQHAGKIGRMANENAMSVMSYGKGDLVIQNFDNKVKVLRSFAEASKKEGHHGPEFLLDMYEAQMDSALSKYQRFSANWMTMADAFVKSSIGVAEARGRAFDRLFEPGKRLMPKDFKKAQKAAYDEMVDSKGFLTDQANKHFSGEIALNLDSDFSRGVSSLVQQNPWVKPFILFPKTSANMLGMFAEYGPIAGITKNFWDLVGYKSMDEVPHEHIMEVLGRKGIDFDENAISTFRQMRYEAKGRIAAGSLAIYATSQMFMQNNIRGYGSYDKERQRVRTDNGWMEKTYKGWDGKWHSYDWLGPLGDWIAVTSTVMDNFDEISSAQYEHLTEKLKYVLAASITNKSVMAMMEPMNDVLAGNDSAAARWGANFINASMLPLGGLRGQFSKILSEGLNEVSDDLGELLRNKNSGLLNVVDPDGALSEKYDWVDGIKVGYVEDFFQRGVNVITGHKMADSLSPEKQFLIDIEYNARPTFQKGDEGVEYTSDQTSALYYAVGESGQFNRELKNIMQRADVREYMKEMKAARKKGIPSTKVDATTWDNIHPLIDAALRRAVKAAKSKIPAKLRDEISEAERVSRMTKAANRGGNMDFILKNK